MSSKKRLHYRSQPVPTVESDPESPTSPSTIRSGKGDDDAASNYESSTEDTPVPPAPHTLLVDDPFSTDISKILFESIGASPTPSVSF
jgi:hypothetical protein